MAYTVPGMTGVPGSVYYTNQSYYMKGATLPSIGSGHRLYALTAASLSSGFEVAPAYGYISSIGAWAFFGWSYQDAYLNIPFLTSINGKNVTALCRWTYNENTNACTLDASRGAYELYSDGNTRAKTLTGFAPTIPSTITYMPRLFYGQTQLKGIINIDANPTTYTDWLKGTRQLIKLTGKSTMLEELAAGYSNVSVYILPTAKLLAQRINAETGDLDDEGTKPKITMTMTGDPVNTTYSLELYMDDLSTPLDTRTFTVPDSGEYEIIFTPNETLDMDTSHTFRAKITDSYGTVREVSDVLTQAFFTMDMGFEGHEIAFGGSAKELQDLKDAGREDEIPANGKFNCFMDVGFHGNVTIDGKPIHAQSSYRYDFSLTQHSTTGVSANNGSYAEGRFTATKAGYYPFAIGSFKCVNGSGSGSSYSIFNVMEMSARTTGSCTVNWRIRAISGNVSKCTITVNILWIKESEIEPSESTPGSPSTPVFPSYTNVAPYIGDDGYWYTYDNKSDRYINTEVKAVMVEEDPTVYDWAKSEIKPSYTESEIGISSIETQEIDDMFELLF